MEMHILVAAVGFYLMHAWIWRPNPAGMFADWNPEVSCSELAAALATAARMFPGSRGG